MALTSASSGVLAPSWCADVVPRRSALVVIPEVESAVSGIRQRMDPVAPLGVPAHVTVLFPFKPADQIDDDVRAVIADAVCGVPCFEHTLTSTHWFGQDVLWRASTADAEFREGTDPILGRGIS